MRLNTKQSDLEGKVSFCPSVLLVSTPGKRGTKNQDALLHVFPLFYPHFQKVEVSTQNSVLLPLPPVCMQVNEHICNGMTQFPSALPLPFLSFSLYLFSLTHLYGEGEGQRNWTLCPLT